MTSARSVSSSTASWLVSNSWINQSSVGSYRSTARQNRRKKPLNKLSHNYEKLFTLLSAGEPKTHRTLSMKLIHAPHLAWHDRQKYISALRPRVSLQVSTPLTPPVQSWSTCFSQRTTAQAAECQLCHTDASTPASTGCLLFRSSQHWTDSCCKQSRNFCSEELKMLSLRSVGSRCCRNTPKLGSASSRAGFQLRVMRKWRQCSKERLPVGAAV